MFGYITINRGELKVRELETYESYYCGLCRMLKDRYGLAGCTMLNYDMTFLGMLLSSLYEEKETPAKRVCRPGSKKRLEKSLPNSQMPKQAVITESLGYAADMNYMLSYHNHMDNWLDDNSFASLNMVHLMQKKYRSLAKKYPRQHKAIASYIQKLHLCEAANEPDIEAAANLTGEAMAEIYAAKDDVWKDILRQMGYYMGKFIYLMDAYDDVEKDSKDGSYNPLKELYKQDGFDEKVREYLSLIMSCCCRAFEVLPIIDNAEIMRNILYAGVWVKYTRVMQERKKPEHSGEGENKAASNAAE